MALFGLHGDTSRACRESVLTARDIWRGIDDLNAELKNDLPWPLRFGIGIHAGVSIVGLSAIHAASAVQFLGDTGNVCSRLERLSKDVEHPVILSARVATLAGLADAALESRHLPLDGQVDSFDVVMVPSLADLETAIEEQLVGIMDVFYGSKGS